MKELREPTRQRVVLLGPPLAGKWTLMHALASRAKATARSFERPIEGHPHLGDRAQVLDVAGCEVLTFPGGVFSKRAWPAVLESASGVVLVLDSQEARIEANALAVETLADVGAALIGCVALTKQDLVAKGINAFAVDTVLGRTPFRDWPVFRTSIEDPLTLIAPVEWILSRLRAGGGVNGHLGA